jgi:hypothetical protein
VFLVLIGMLIYFGLGILLTFVVYRRMAKQGRSWRVRVGAVLTVAFVVWAIPYGDHTLGKIEFKILCGKEAGLRIYRSVSDVEGYRSPWVSNDSPKAHGYVFAEQINRDGTVTRYTLRSNGTVTEERGAKPVSRYVLDRRQIAINSQITRSEYFIVDSKTNEKLAERVGFGHHGGWLPRQLAAMHTYHAACPSEPFSMGRFLREVLMPKQGRN